MLQDVWQASGVARRRDEGNAEDLVLVVVNQRKQLRARLHMAVEDGLAIDLGDEHFAELLKTVGDLHKRRGYHQPLENSTASCCFFLRAYLAP